MFFQVLRVFGYFSFTIAWEKEMWVETYCRFCLVSVYEKYVMNDIIMDSSSICLIFLGVFRIEFLNLSRIFWIPYSHILSIG